MLKVICNISLPKNTLLNKENNFFEIICKQDTSKSIFSELNKYLISKEIVFDNTNEEEKKDDQNHLICTNFIMNNLLYILNQKNINLNSNESKNIKHDSLEKKIGKYENILVNNLNSSKKIKILPIKNDQKKIKKLEKELFLNQFIKNKNQICQFNELNNVNTVKNFRSKKLSDKLLKTNKNIFYINKNNIQPIKNEKTNIFLLNVQNQKNNFLLSKSINKINNTIIEKQFLQESNKKEYIKSNVDLLTLNDSKNSIELKKLMTKKIFLSISNKDNQAEIHLKPKSLGSIRIFINMKNDEVTLNFISKNRSIRIFLDNCIPFLRNSLMRNGMKLEKFNICNSFNNYISNNYKYQLNENFFNINRFRKKLNIKKESETLRYKLIDIYV